MTAEFPWTSVGVATGHRGNSRVSTTSATAHGVHGSCHRCDHGTCRGSVRGKLRRANDGNPQKSAVIATAVSVAKSTAIRGHYHGNAAITTEFRGNPRQFSRQFPRTPNRSNFHGHYWWPSAAIATARAVVLSVANSVVPTMPTEVRGNCHCSFRGNGVRKSGNTPQ